MTAIEIISLTKSFGGFVAVDNVTMKVQEGEFMGLLGPNGAGKSTILKTIAGMIKPTSGEILVNGTDSKIHHIAMRGVGCIIETPECYSNFTPIEMLRYIGEIRGIKRNEIDDRIRYVLEEVNMLEWKDEPIGKFSKGMKQRISLAQALLPNPDILILDEPTSGLDPRGMVEVREILAKLKAKGKTMLISTHMLNEVSELCDSVTMIRQGQVVVSGNVKDLLTTKDGGTIVEIGVRNEMSIDAKNAIASVYKETEFTDSNIFRIKAQDQETVDKIIGVIMEYKLGLVKMVEKGSDLESLYMSYTQDGDRNEVR
ncbi:MAG: ABC transporter ATP-binding protein [Candidatus Methanoplasma sp.]|jgi:ABC-2 type transport system ATP-binding protein|nr:ABC transporter ATP-binding protein [Candidatus Methanoplasma sp.]